MAEQHKSIIFGLLADKPVAYHPDIAKMLKSTTACIFLSQLLYWLGRGHDSEWIYKTQAEWYEETGLTRKEQETARKKLRDAGILIEARRGQPARLYYQINFDRLAECLSEYYDKLKNPDPNPPKPSNTKDEREHSRMPERDNLECPKETNLIARKSHSIYTENTTENTTDIVVVPHAEKRQKGDKLEPGNIAEANSKFKLQENNTNPDFYSENNISEIQKLIDETCGAQMPLEILRDLTDKYGAEKIKEKISLLGRVETENAPGFLIAALKDDYQLRPGRPRQRQSISRASPQRRPEVQKKARDSRDDEELRHRKERKEIYKTLYAG